MSDRKLIGYAVLKANHNANAPSFLDNFLAFGLDVLARHYPASCTDSEVAREVQERFGLVIPDRVMAKILKRGSRAGRLLECPGDRSQPPRYSIEQGASKRLADLQQNIVKYEREQNELADRFVEWVRRSYPGHEQLVEGDAAGVIQNYVDRHVVPIMATAINGGEYNDSLDVGHGVGYLVSGYIAHISREDSTSFEYLVGAVKGAILSAVLRMNTGELHQKLTSLNVYYDTPLLLRILGFQGDTHETAALQLLTLMKELGISPKCFRHTFNETRNVLESAANSLQQGIWTRPGGLTEVDVHLSRSGISKADLTIRIAKLEDSLDDLGIAIERKPDLYHEFGLDEQKLEDDLKVHVGHFSRTALLHDVDSISAVHMLRQGALPASIERCSHILITDNVKIVGVTRRMRQGREVPLAMSDSDLAALLWVRNPTAADNLPEAQLRAVAFSGMQPAPHFWARYLSEIEQLSELGTIDAKDALILRSSSLALDEVMNETLGDEDLITDVAVSEALESVKKELMGPLEEELARVAAERERSDSVVEQQTQEILATRAENSELASNAAVLAALNDQLARETKSTAKEIELIKDHLVSQDRSLRDAAKRSASLAVTSASVVLAVLALLVAFLDKLVPSWTLALPGWARIVVVLVGGIPLIVSLLPILGESGGMKEKMVQSLAARIERRRRRKFGVASWES